MKKLFIACLIIAGSLTAMDLQIPDESDHIVKIENENIFASHALKKLDLYYDGSDFKICHNKRMYTVENHELDPTLRKINASNIQQFLKVGSIRVSQLSDGRFALKSHIKGLCGGPVSGAVAYWATKTICYGTAVAAAESAKVITGGAAGGVMGVLTTASTLGTSGAVSLVGGAIAGSTLTAEATLITAGAISSAGSVAAAAAAVESASLSVGALFTLCPFLP